MSQQCISQIVNKAKELGKEINREKVLVEIIEILDKVIQKQVNQ